MSVIWRPEPQNLVSMECLGKGRVRIHDALLVSDSTQDSRDVPHSGQCNSFKDFEYIEQD